MSVKQNLVYHLVKGYVVLEGLEPALHWCIISDEGTKNNVAKILVWYKFDQMSL